MFDQSNNDQSKLSARFNADSFKKTGKDSEGKGLGQEAVPSDEDAQMHIESEVNINMLHDDAALLKPEQKSKAPNNNTQPEVKENDQDANKEAEKDNGK